MRSYAVVAAVLVSSCAAATPPPARVAVGTPSAPRASAVPTPAPERFVLVHADAPFYANPREDARITTEPRWPHPSPEPFRLVAQDDAWSEIESFGEPSAYDRHCDIALSFPESRVRVFVHTPDLVPVTARPVDVTFANGTFVKLRPGVAVGRPLEGAPAGAERHVVETGGARFLLDLPAGAIATSYVPAEWPPAPRELHLRVRVTVPLLFGDAVPETPLALVGDADRADPFLSAQHDPGDDTPRLGVIPPPQASLFVFADAPHPAGRLVETATRCMDAKVVVPRDALVETRPTRWPREEPHHERRIQPDRWRARADARLTWPDGTAAGTTLAPITLNGDGKTRDARRCFPSIRGDFSLLGAVERPGATLCFAAADLSLWPEHLPESETSAIRSETRRYVVVRVEVPASSARATEMVRAVRAAVKDGLLVEPGTALAPPDEDEATSVRTAGSHQLPVFGLTIDVAPVKRREGMADGAIVVRLARLPSGEQILERPLHFGTGASDDDAAVVKHILTGEFPPVLAAMQAR